jgi:hypothetical protein
VVWHSISARERPVEKRRIMIRVIFIEISLGGRRAFGNLRKLQEMPEYSPSHFRKFSG